MLIDKVWIVDEPKLYPEFIEAYRKGKAAIHDGVAYWAQGSGNKGIIQHLPFKEASFLNISEALKAAQMTTVIASAVSTTIILGAIIIQTRYLAEKLDKIQKTVDLISQDLHSHSILFYMDKISDYFGSIETARVLLKDRSLSEEIRDIAVLLLTSLSNNRNKLLSFIDSILSLAKTPAISQRHFELIVNFVQMMLETIPMGIHLEYLLSARVGKIQLAEQILLDGAERYEIVINCYRSFLNQLYKESVHGIIGDKAIVFKEIENRALNLLKKNEYKLLLSLPTGRVAPLAIENH